MYSEMIYILYLFAAASIGCGLFVFVVAAMYILCPDLRQAIKDEWDNGSL